MKAQVKETIRTKDGDIKLADFDIEIDVQGLVRHLGQKAYGNRSGVARYVDGLVVVTFVEISQ